ncbi:SH3 domain-binding protein 5-like [Asterias rubens]|uniref:SH3 domain-binding protein 5-like n=1 Tax=Asterias rubens TaxID=7604 RepID=UPI001455B61E|nr:SH3 domain-binding protein 5-like [Asterias rubens]
MAETEQQGARLDPRIKGELDKLNSTSEEINSLEKELDDARQQFRVTLTESSYKLNEAAKRCGKAVKKAKSYHEARIKAHKAQEKVQEAAHTYQRAVGMFQAAKETITIAEETSMQGRKKRDFDSALQEMLNHATLKLNSAEHEKLRGQKEHAQLSQAYERSQVKVEQLGKKLRKSIGKSAAYYDLRDAFYSRLENLKDSVDKLQKMLAKSKKRYREALRNLEMISEDIHHSRRQQSDAAPTLQERSSGVGAESDQIGPKRGSDQDEEEEGNLEKVADLDTNENSIRTHPFSNPSQGGNSFRSASFSNSNRTSSFSDPGGNSIRSSSFSYSFRTSSFSSPIASGGIDEAEDPTSSYSTSPEDDVPQSPLLTEHGLPTLRREDSMNDPDFYSSEKAIAKLPGLLPEDQELIEATCRGYKSFDAELTEEEVTVLGKGASGPPVIVVESPEGVIGEPVEDEIEEVEVYEPEEIEMSELQNVESGSNEGGDFSVAESSVEVITIEQETRLNGVIDDISPEQSEGEISDEENAGQDTPTEKHSAVNSEPVSLDESHISVVNNQEDQDDHRQRAPSVGVKKQIQEDFDFSDPLPTSPIQQIQAAELERPGSPALFRYRADKHTEDVHEPDDTMAINTSLPIIPVDDVVITSANENQNCDEAEC